MSQIYTIGETKAAKMDFCLMLVDETDLITPETDEGGQQPQIRKPGESEWTDTTNLLVHVGNGHYVVLLTTAELDTLGVFSIRYKSDNTLEFQHTGYVQAIGSTNTDDLKQLIIKLQKKVDWIEYIMSRDEKSEITKRELNIL